MRINIFLLVLISFEHYAAFNVPQKSSSPYFDVLIDRTEQIYADKSYVDWSDLKIRKVNKTRAIFGSLNIYQDIGNEITAAVKIYVKQGGEYRLTPYRVPPKKFCDFLAEDEFAYPDLAAHSDFPADIKNNCPLKKNNYTVSGAYFPLEKFPRSATGSGDYAAEILYHKDEQLIFQFRLYSSIIYIM